MFCSVRPTQRRWPNEAEIRTVEKMSRRVKFSRLPVAYGSRRKPLSSKQGFLDPPGARPIRKRPVADALQGAHAYIDGAGLASDPKALLFQTYSRATGSPEIPSPRRTPMR